jgi:NADH dehydrogenase
MILLAGSTGFVGGMIARMLLERSHPLTILVRPASDHQPLVDAGARAVFGDLKDRESLAAACRGIDTVITTASAGQRGGDDTPETVDLEGNRSLIEAARDAGVKQFIYISALAGTVDHPVPLPRAKALTEVTLRESGVPYTILAANGIMDVMLPMVIGYPLSLGRPVTLVGEGQRRHSFVAARDIAAFAVAAVDHPEAVNRRIPVGGPAALTWHDMIDAYERGLGRRIQVEWIKPGELLPDLPPEPGLTQFVSALLASLEMFDSPVDMTAASRTFGVTPTTIDEFVASQRQRMPHAESAVPNA